jgi:extracellular elastinolytic metalloproteinase
MRRLLAALLLLTGLSRDVLGSIHDHSSSGKRRKTLGFGPHHPHAIFDTNPLQVSSNSFSPLGPDSDPIDVAQQFMVDRLGDKLSESNTFAIRKDSYTDKSTGVTHVYVRQIVNGLEVADGDVNINIKDGWVLSYGSSVRSYFMSSHVIFFDSYLLFFTGSSIPDRFLPLS